MNSARGATNTALIAADMPASYGIFNMSANAPSGFEWRARIMVQRLCGRFELVGC